MSGYGPLRNFERLAANDCSEPKVYGAAICLDFR